MAPAKSTGIIVAEAVEAFLARCEQRHISPATMSKYRTFTKQLTAFCDAGGYTRLAQLSVIDMDGFYASRRGGKRARAKLERLRAFVKFALSGSG